MKNYKPKARYLEEYQVEALKNMGFFSPSIGRKEQIDKHTQYLQKYYGMCGSVFRLNILLDSYFFGDTYCPAYVGLESPYDFWWHQEWNIKEFTEEVRDFYEELNGDIGALVALGIIEEDKDDNNMYLEVYIIQSLDEDEEYKYHMRDGEFTNRLQKAEFYADEKLAKNELTKFDEPDEYEIRKIIVSMKFDEE